MTTSRLRPKRTGYLPSLDGWRALAILGVIMDHDQPWVFAGHSNVHFHEYGGIGLYLFFALSGVLVCTRILEDESLLGRFRLKSFYIRRLFRIQPAAWVYLATIALLDLVHVTHERGSALLGGFFLYQNYLYNPQDHSFRWVLTGHFWTLAVEEHFYLLLSLVLLWSHRKRTVALSLIWAVLLIWPQVANRLHIYGASYSPRASELQLQFLFGAALAALLLRRKPVMDWCLAYLHPGLVIFLTLLFKTVWLFAFRAPSPYRPGFVEWLITAPYFLLYGFTFWVIATMLHPRSWVTRFLETPPLRFIGRLSYSLYLWHVLFLVPLFPETGITSPWLLFLCQRPWRYVCIAIAALLSYYFVEKPLIRLGHRLAPPATPGHRDLAPSTSETPVYVP